LTALPLAAQVASLDTQPGALSTWKPRFRLATIASGSARQIKGLASVSLCSATKRLIAAWKGAVKVARRPVRPSIEPVFDLFWLGSAVLIFLPADQ
jgi:hypothetical protein